MAAAHLEEAGLPSLATHGHAGQLGIEFSRKTAFRDLPWAHKLCGAKAAGLDPSRTPSSIATVVRSSSSPSSSTANCKDIIRDSIAHQMNRFSRTFGAFMLLLAMNVHKYYYVYCLL